MESTAATAPTTESLSPPDNRSWRNRVIAIGAAAGLTLAGLGVASAQTDAADPPAVDGDGPAVVMPGPGGKMFAGGRGGHMGFAMGMGMGIHGENTVPGPNGEGYQTIAHQTGEVTEVSASSVTVKSVDGFSRSYTVNDDTLVNAGNDGIADVKKGNDVRVTAVVKDGKATAVALHDQTNIAASREKWAPMPKLRERAAAAKAATSS